MTKKIAGTAPAYTRSLQGFAIRYIAAILLLLSILIPERSSAQNEQGYDEISVFLNVPRIGGADLPAVIRDEVVYLPVTDLFDFLKIKNTFSPGFDSITGFFINQQAKYLIDRLHNRIDYQQKVFDLKPGDMIRTETNLYLKINYFGEVFGLQCTFSFRSLSVTLNTKLELPIIREMRQEQMRKNISQLKGEIKADTTIRRSYPLFHFGMADWSVISSQQIQGKTDTRLTLTLGSVIAGGEANATLNFNNNTAFTEKQQYYLWRYANNDQKIIRQVSAGKISSGATSSLYSPVVGIQFTNTPTTFRRSFGSYTLSDFTEPGWLVELYVSNVLVDFVKADASGFFTFEVPLVYGNSGVKLQYYGPWGEERSKEQNISIPFNFLPVGEFEYKVSGGMVEDGKGSRFSRGVFSYGVSRRLTFGGGLEYLSSITSGNLMPFLNTSLRLASSLLVSGEYTYGVRSKGILSYRLPSNVQFELNYTKYQKGQKAINYNYLEERKVALSVPIRSANFAAFSRLTLNQIIMPKTKYSTAELLLSGSIFGVNTNLTTYSLLSDLARPYTYSNLSLSIKLPGAIILTPQSQFEYNGGKFISAKCGLEKHVFKQGFLNFSYEKNFRSNVSNMELGFRYDFSFAQVGLSARRSNNSTTLVQSASGSLMVDAKSDYLGATSHVSVGKGGLTLLPFLDLNCNGIRESNEPKAYGLTLHINGGRVEFNEKDTITRVFDLEPYSKYLVTFDGTSFDNIAWQMRKKTISVTVDPNMFKLIEVPISVFGEAAGTVYLGSGSGQKGQGRIIVNFYRKDLSLAARTLSEADGYFSFLGLVPGEYVARIDTTQLNKLHMTSSPSTSPFTITAGRDGDVVDGLEFVLRSELNESRNKQELSPELKIEVPETEGKELPPTNQAVPKQQQKVLSPEKPEKPENTQPKTNYYLKEQALTVNDTMVYVPGTTLYKVQLLALRNQMKDRIYFKQLLTDVPGLTITETLGEDGLYHYCSRVFLSLAEAREVLGMIRKSGWKDCFIVIYLAGERADIAEQVSTDKDMLVYVPGTTLYKVQLLSLPKSIKDKNYFTKLLKDVSGLKVMETLEEDGLYHYSSRIFIDIEEARSLMRIIRKSGWKDCFITVYKAGKRDEPILRLKPTKPTH